jgi:murein DD-endopeptidase MepM/ murein hydrolase activator NlpD
MAVMLCGCIAQGQAIGGYQTPTPQSTPENGPTPLPSRGSHIAGETVIYYAQSGDTLQSVAAHFNTTVEDILTENPDVPAGVTTLPPGYPMQVTDFHLPLSGTPFHLLPDSEVINSASAIGFDTREEILRRTGFLAGLSSIAYDQERAAWGVVDVVAQRYSLHPRLLLTLLEYQTQALTSPFATADAEIYPLGYRNHRFRGLFRQLMWAAEQINDGYYGWRAGTLSEFELADGFIQRPDPWQNAGTVGLHFLFAALYDLEEFNQVVSPEGFYRTYLQLWGDPFENELIIIPGDLHQPVLSLPFVPNTIWSYTGGPHSAWGTSLPNGAIDFAPPAGESGCIQSPHWITAPADGVIARSGEAFVILDLDGDGEERTGWVLMFFHVAALGMIEEGTQVSTGDILGHPSCEGGRATGTHVHMARLYNGEYVDADGVLPFVLSDWIVQSGNRAYAGTMVKGSRVVVASDTSDDFSHIWLEGP